MLPSLILPTRARWTAALSATLLAYGLANAADKPLDVPYVLTPQAVVDRMLELGQVDGNDYVIDLGSGDGRIPVTAAAKYGARAMGVDLNPTRIAEAKENAKQANVVDKVEFKHQDLFETSIADATVLTMYLLPRVNMQLRPRILSELAPGTRVVSHAFDMEDWEPDHRESVEGRTVYLWIVPARVQGTWKVSGGDSFTLELEQQFQKVSGKADRKGKSADVTQGVIEGDRITFTLDGKKYSGGVKDNTITGDGWSATKS